MTNLQFSFFLAKQKPHKCAMFEARAYCRKSKARRKNSKARRTNSKARRKNSKARCKTRKFGGFLYAKCMDAKPPVLAVYAHGDFGVASPFSLALTYKDRRRDLHALRHNSCTDNSSVERKNFWADNLNFPKAQNVGPKDNYLHTLANSDSRFSRANFPPMHTHLRACFP